MAREERYTADQLLDAAGQAVLEHWRSATVRHVLDLSGAPSGSVYHRFPTRHALFGALWERSIRRFHVGLLEAMAHPDPREALRAATVHIPRYCRQNPVDAKAMTLYRLPDLLDLVPTERRATLATINDDVNRALHDLVTRRFGQDTPERYQLALMATRQCPYGMIRPLIGQPIPPELDAMCIAASEGILALGDQ
ncbi:TetR/AcrR family transcriptional regulator [Luteococcus sp. H138]|uniref:TetR/AcrR family transcriptional regulator n=1 Tax=unclassified Luteococcus TaxID=2639923 RepID=UPI00313D81CA